MYLQENYSRIFSIIGLIFVGICLILFVAVLFAPSNPQPIFRPAPTPTPTLGDRIIGSMVDNSDHIVEALIALISSWGAIYLGYRLRQRKGPRKPKKKV